MNELAVLAGLALGIVFVWVPWALIRAEGRRERSVERRTEQ